MFKLLFAILLTGSVVCGATQFPSHMGMGSKASTVGKISSYSRVQNGLWTGYWKPNNFTVSVREENLPAPTTNVWPNPNKGLFNIDYVGNVKVFSSLGSLIFEGHTNGLIDVSNSPSGLYFVRTQDGKTTKIIIQ